jgi:tetratricopeptide (TPR) repeat protein
MRKKVLSLTLVVLPAINLQATVISYETSTPTSNIVAFENGASRNSSSFESNSLNLGQSFTATDNHPAVKELWFQSSNLINQNGKAVLSITFWKSTGQRKESNDWSNKKYFKKNAKPVLIGSYPLPQGKPNRKTRWVKISFDAAAQDLIGQLVAGQQYAFSLSLETNGNSFKIARSGRSDETQDKYSEGFFFKISDGNALLMPYDANFYVVHAGSSSTQVAPPSVAVLTSSSRSKPDTPGSVSAPPSQVTRNVPVPAPGSIELAFEKTMAKGNDLLRNQNKPEVALETFMLATELTSDEDKQAAAIVLACSCMIEQNQTEQAIEYLNTIIQIPNLKTEVLGNAYMLLGDTYAFKLGDKQTGMSHYQKIIDFYEHSEELRNEAIQKIIQIAR